MDRATAKALRIASAITLANVLIAGGFSLAGVLRPDWIAPHGAALGDAAMLFALYAAARALPLAGVVVTAVAMGSPTGLLILGTLAGIIQCMDAAIGAIYGDIGKTVGPLVLAALQAYATLNLSRVLRTQRESDHWLRDR